MNSMDDTSLQLIVYTNSQIRCPYCVAAKKALTDGNYRFEERDIANPEIKSELLRKRPSVRTVPQIFLINDTYIGGCDDLLSLIRQDRLDTIIDLNS